jgi:SAM-dependent MidA family methyltransferase
MNCGLAQRLAAADIRQRAAAQKLMQEHEMGELFKVIAFGRGLPDGFDPVGFTHGDRSHRL